MAKKPTPDFEHTLSELETLVERMEKGELTLEASLGDFERGIQLIRLCQKSLAEAEQKVQILMEKDGAAQAEPFESDDE